MANHVSGYVSLVGASPAAQKVWDEYVVDKLNGHKKEGDWEVHLGHYLFDYDDGEFTNWDFDTMCEEVGAKWAYATDWDDTFVSVYSAWSPVVEWCEMISAKMAQVCKEFQIVFTYEDEMPNFVGVAVLDHTGLDMQVDLDGDELLQLILESDSDLNEMYDHEAEEWKDGMEEDAYEILWEIQSDFIHDWQQNQIS